MYIFVLFHCDKYFYNPTRIKTGRFQFALSLVVASLELARESFVVAKMKQLHKGWD